jgi:hypothetical protein
MGAALVVPAMDAEGNVQSLQFIQPDGSKRFLKDAGTTGSSFTIHGSEPGVIAVVEGVATGASVQAATGWSVVCAFSAGNLGKVAEQVRGKFPNARIIIAGDNDESGAGEKYGRAAAEAVGGRYVQPEAVGHDWNDVAKEKGLEAVKKGLESIGGGVLDRARVDWKQFTARRWIHTTPPVLDWCLENSLLAGSTGYIVGPPSTGKSTFELELGMSVVCGEELFPALRPGGFAPHRVLVLTTEDCEEILHHRVRRLARDLFPDQLEAISDNLVVLPLQGEDVRLMIKNQSGNYVQSDAFRAVMDIAREIKPRLAFFDPLARLQGAGENDSEAGTFITTLLESIAKETGSSVCCIHHTSKRACLGKGGAFDLEAAMDPDALRGSSALTGAVRWQLNLAVLPEKNAKNQGRTNPPTNNLKSLKNSKKKMSSIKRTLRKLPLMRRPQR